MVESIREREVLYKLIISQLRYDGLDMVAANLAKCVGLETTPLSPSSRLLGLMKLGLQEEKNGLVPETNNVPGLVPPVPPAHGLDLEYETEEPTVVGKQSDSTVPRNAQDNAKPMLPRRQQIVSGSHSENNIDDVDLNAQPTMIAYKVAEYENETTFEEDYCAEDNDHDIEAGDDDFENKHPSKSDNGTTSCISKIEQTVEQFIDGYPENNYDGSDDDCYELTSDNSLEKMVSFDPRNKGKLVGLSRKDSTKYISRLFRPYRDEFQQLDFKSLVSKEVIHFRINQCIFSKTVLGRSQGYLSDLLNHQEAIMNMEEPTRMFINFVKIHQFLALDESERRLRYTECVKESDAEKQRLESVDQPKISPRRKRMKLSREVKGQLILLFKDREYMPDHEELSILCKRFDLEMPTLKNFFRNFKARTKMADK